MSDSPILQFVLRCVDDLKARDIQVLKIDSQNILTDFMVIVSGTSTQHVKAIAQHLLKEAKSQHIHSLGHEGLEHGEWVAIDLSDVVVHIMLPQTRVYYQLESLWSGLTSPLELDAHFSKDPNRIH